VRLLLHEKPFLQEALFWQPPVGGVVIMMLVWQSCSFITTTSLPQPYVCSENSNSFANPSQDFDVFTVLGESFVVEVKKITGYS
jgi:hypothetical protein